MKDWALLYDRQPPQLDAILFVVALVLHMPLLTLHMAAPQKGAKGAKQGRLHNIDFIEKQTEKRKEKPAVLPPKAPDVAKIKEEAAKIREKLLKKAAPPPPALPKPLAQQNLATAPDPSKIQMDLKKQMEMQNNKLLENKKSFMDKATLAGASPKEMKLGGGVSAINMGARPGALPGPGSAPALKGRSGFAVADGAMPASIGGADDGLKMGGGPAIVVPTGRRAQGDSNILSSVAVFKDRGALQSKDGGGGAGLAGAPGPSAGLVLGPGGGGPIVGGGARPTAAAPAGPVLAGRQGFAEKPASSAAPASPGSGLRSGSALPSVGALPRKPRAERSMFEITGPLKDRPIVSRVLPEYPEWARAKSVEAMVTLQFTVTPDGTVKDTIIVMRTTGYPSLDEAAKDALRQWRFAALSADKIQQDQVGAITMNFSVR